MISLFKLFSRQQHTPKAPQGSPQSSTPELPHLDAALYPLSLAYPFEQADPHDNLNESQMDNKQVQPQRFASAYQVLLAVCQAIGISSDISNSSLISTASEDFSQQLQHNEVYQDWVNFTVFGGYVQRSFRAFYRQSEDVFNADMPDLLRHELMRHTQRLPLNQVVLFASEMPKTVRQEKLLITTINPVQAVITATHLAAGYGKRRTQKSQSAIIINLITTVSDQVKAFAVKHNRRTQERLRHEVIILDFNHLILVKEERLAWTGEIQEEADSTQSDIGYLIRHYHIG